VDQFTDRWSRFDSFVPKTSPHYVRKFPWVTKELDSLKSRTTKAAKNMKKSNLLIMVDDDDDCDCE
jgi:hypothetical protein